jgi:hypothetical protein
MVSLTPFSHRGIRSRNPGISLSLRLSDPFSSPLALPFLAFWDWLCYSISLYGSNRWMGPVVHPTIPVGGRVWNPPLP